MYKDIYTIYYDIKRNVGVSDGRHEYSQDGGFVPRDDAVSPIVDWGSFFRDLGRDWYLYKYVYRVQRTSRTDITPDWNESGASSDYDLIDGTTP